MRRTLTALLIALLLVPDLPARTNHSLENVKKVKPGTPIQILLWTGDDVSAELDEVSDAGLRLYTAADRTAAQTTWQLDVDRKNIRRIAVVRYENLPDSGHWMSVGALTGAAVGAAVGGIQDAKQGNNARWIAGGFVGALIGFFATCAVLLTEGTAKLAQGPRHTKIIYEAKKAPPRPSN
jgi:hypothetical protein